MRPIARPIALGLLMVLTAGGVTTPALAQRGRNVFPDEGVGTRDALLRVGELNQAGNAPEALRVLQKTLENEGSQLVQTESLDLFVPVRSHIHALLLSQPELLTRYRLEQEPAARKLLDEGRLAELEQSRLLTTSGFEGALRLAQVELESARFESARLMLAQLEGHPDRAKGAAGAAPAARLAGLVAAYLPRAEVKAWATRWATEAGLDPSKAIPAEAPKVPAEAGMKGVSPLGQQALPRLKGVPQRPLQSVALDVERLEAERNGTIKDYQLRQAPQPWMIPTLSNGVVYVNDGRRITAWDSATLGELWQVTPSRTSTNSARPVQDDDFGGGFFQAGAVQKEDAATVTLGNGIAVGVTGMAEGRQRLGDRRLHAIEAATGRLLWSIDPATLSNKLVGGAVYGQPLVEADTIVLAMRSLGTMRRDTRHYLVGVNLYTGAMRWIRLVGTQQSPVFGRSQGRPDGGVLHEGIYYRCDEIGAMYAYEACSGRPVWLRTMPPNTMSNMMQFGGREAQPAQEVHVPVIDGDAVMGIEFPKGRVVRVSRASGELLAKRDGSALGDPRYLVRVGEWIVGANSMRLAFFKGAEMESGTVQLVSPSMREVFAGRVSAAGGMALVPLENGAALIDPANPTVQTTATFEGSGNLLVAGDGDQTHLVSADPTRLHTFLSWEEAERILTARVAAQPSASQPLLTFVELAARTGRAERVPELADRALSVLDGQAGSPEAVRQRGRLFKMLLDMVRTSRGAWSAPNQPLAVGAASPVQDIALLGKVMERLERSAESGQEQVAMLLEKAWLADKQNDAAGAIEAYQRVLTDTGLAAMELDPGARLQGDDARGASSFSNARTEATDRLVALVRRVGPGPYAAFDEEAERLLADTDVTNAERLAELARAYPVAAVTPEAWNRASGAYAAEGKPQQARLAAGSGLAAAELGALIGRQSTGEMLGRLAGSLLTRSTGPADIEPAYRLMARLSKQVPDLAVDWNGTAAAPRAIVSELRAKLAARTGMPVIGPNLLRTVQVIETWEPMEPVVRNAPGVSGDCVAMANENTKAISMWGVAAEDGKLRQMWSRSFQMKPIVVRITPDSTLLFWPSQTGGAVEAVSTLDGKPLWRTPEFASLFEKEGAEGGDDRVNTPLDGPVRTNDLVVTADGQTLVLAQRRGRVGAFDLATGNSLWTTTLDLTRVYELEQAGDAIVIGGTGPGKGKGSSASVVALNKRTGKQLSRLGPEQLGDHARWMRAVGEDAIVATATGMLRYTPATGKVAWFTSGLPGASSFAGWVVGDGMYVLDGDVNLWFVSLKDGAHADKPLDTRGRVVFPVSATVMNGTLAVTSTNGIIVFNDKGELIGADGLDGQGSLQTPMVSSNMFLAVENNQREDGGPTGIVSRLFMFAHPTGKLINTERVRLYENPHASMVIDGKVLLSEGPVTLVLDAPPK